jgi:hypothetical protein
MVERVLVGEDLMCTASPRFAVFARAVCDGGLEEAHELLGAAMPHHVFAQLCGLNTVHAPPCERI